MATGKRYYWIKLRESFMTSDTVDFLMSQKGGANYVVLYQMLCLKTINTGGRLSRTIGEIVIPYDVEKIQRDCKWFSADTIRVALGLYKRFGLIYEDVDGTLVLVQHDSMVGSETDWAKQKRAQKSLAEGGNKVELGVESDVETSVESGVETKRKQSGTGVESGVEDFHTDIRDKDTRYQDTRIKNLDTREQIPEKEKEEVGTELCAEPPASGRSTPAPRPEPTPSEFDIPLNDGSTYNVPLENIEVYKRLYPAVDVEQALRNMIGWCIGNPTRLKTRKGVKRFINGWLAGDQDEGKTRRPANQPRQYADEDDFY